MSAEAQVELPEDVRAEIQHMTATQIQHAIAQLKAAGGIGHNDPEYHRQALAAGERRARGEFEDFLRHQFQETWAVDDKSGTEQTPEEADGTEVQASEDNDLMDVDSCGVHHRPRDDDDDDNGYHSDQAGDSYQPDAYEHEVAENGERSHANQQGEHSHGMTQQGERNHCINEPGDHNHGIDQEDDDDSDDGQRVDSDFLNCKQHILCPRP